MSKRFHAGKVRNVGPDVWIEEPASIALLFQKEGIREENGSFLSQNKIDQLWRFHRLLQEHNEDRDLSRLFRFDEMLLKHYLDSALVLRYLNTLPSPLLDIGTGAGFPGMVLKILRPQTEIVLAEVRKKRVEFLEKVISELQLEKISCFAHRVGPSFPLPVRGVITRALESAQDTLKRSSFFLPQGGEVLLLKGPNASEEIKLCEKQFADEFLLKDFFEYRLANSRNERSIYRFERKREKLLRKKGDGFDKSNEPGNEKVKIREITSPANNLYKGFKKLSDSNGIRKENQFFIYGSRIVKEILDLALFDEALASGILGLVLRSDQLSDAYKNIDNLLQRIQKKIYFYLLREDLFRDLDIFQTREPLLLMTLPTLPEWKGDVSESGIDLFLPFQDPGNLGTAIRSAAAFGVRRVILLHESSYPYHPKAVRAAGSSLFLLPLMQGPSFQDFISQSEDLPLALLDLEGKEIQEIGRQNPICLVAGSEGQGFSSLRLSGREMKYRIPIAENVESINAASALSIALFAWNSAR